MGRYGEIERVRGLAELEAQAARRAERVRAAERKALDDERRIAEAAKAERLAKAAEFVTRRGGNSVEDLYGDREVGDLASHLRLVPVEKQRLQEKLRDE